MIIVKHDSDNKVVAYVDYTIVDNTGKQLKLGQYCFVRFVWIHKSVNRKGIPKEFIKEGHKKNPTVKWLYFKRKKYSYRMSIYDINKCYKKETP